MTVFFFILIFGEIVQGVTGFGAAIMIMPILLVVVGRETAVPLINLLGLVMTCYMAWKEREYIDPKELIKGAPWLIAGILGGHFFQLYLKGEWLRKGYGFVVLICVGILIWKDHKEKIQKFPAAVDTALLLFAGVLHSVFASGGPLLVLSMLSKIEDKRTFRATMSAIWVFMDIILGAQHIVSGYYTPQFFRNFAFLFPAMVLGTWIGFRIYPKVNAARFMKIVYVILIFSGIYTIVS